MTPASGAVPQECRRAGNDTNLLQTCALLLAAGCLLAACSWQVPQERASDSAMMRKSASVDRRLAQVPSTQQLIEDLERRTAIVFTNAEEVTVTPVEHQGRRIEWSANEKVGISAAVPIAEDGYFLTAAHSVDDATSVFLVAWVEEAGSRGPRVAPARVVWIASEKQQPDIAILQAQFSHVVPFVLSTEPVADEAVAATGASNWWRIGKRLDNEAGLGMFSAVSFGSVVGDGRMIVAPDVPPYRLIRHTAPTIHGDSGGALVNERGELIGINATVHAPWWLAWLPYVGVRLSVLAGGAGSHSQAVRPDVDWLMDLIELDRQRELVFPAP